MKKNEKLHASRSRRQWFLLEVDEMLDLKGKAV